ncbi:nucleotidase [Martiniozyma asiatica (nom. inval.)]|nr:nucleotidase [Martiniozyma asiatica]
MNNKEFDQREQEILSRHSHTKLPQLADDTPLPPVRLTYPVDSRAPATEGPVFFFDIDNCLYPKSTRIHDLMQIYIHRYFKSSLNLNDEDAHHLHMTYYKQYGLALEGLVRLHKVDAMKYNAVVDDALPLEKILVPNLQLREMLIRLKKSNKNVRLWLFTNAYKNHGLRVIHLLGLGDLFDGLTYCDYNSFPLTCKPMQKAFDKALTDAGAMKEQAYFVDDSEINVRAACDFGWYRTIQYVENDSELPSLATQQEYSQKGMSIVRNITDVENVCKELF